MILTIIFCLIMSTCVIFMCSFLKRKIKILKILNSSKKTYNLYYFLLYHKIYKCFISNLNKEKKINDINIWLKYINKSNAISEAFEWDKTEQGYQYWYDYNKIWITQFKQKRIYLKDVINLIERNL